MFNETFLNYIDQQVAVTHQQFAEIVKAAILKSAPALVNQLDDDSEAFHDPLVFAHISAEDNSYPINQLLFGYLKKEDRPMDLKVLSDSEGVVYLPKVGYFLTDQIDKILKLIWDPVNDDYYLFDNETEIKFRYENIVTVAEGSVEVLRYNHPLLNRFYISETNKVPEFEVTQTTKRHTENLSKAFDILKLQYPDYYEQLIKVTKRIAIFNCSEMNSLATMAAHGAVFLNADVDNNEVFFVEDLAHQCGHVLFNNLTFETEQFLNIDPLTPLKMLTGNESETRTVYDTFHGVFTEAVMFQCLNECYKNKIFEGEKEDELIARIAFILRRFGSDLHNLSFDKLFTEKGDWLFWNIMNCFKEAYAQHEEIVKAFDFFNQPYNFNYKKFVEANRVMMT